MKKIFTALEPGGKIFVIDMMLEADRTKPVFSALFSLNMMLTSPAGRVFAAEDLHRILLGVGFGEVKCEKLADCPYWMVTAEKPRAQD